MNLRNRDYDRLQRPMRGEGPGGQGAGAGDLRGVKKKNELRQCRARLQ